MSQELDDLIDAVKLVLGASMIVVNNMSNPVLFNQLIPHILLSAVELETAYNAFIGEDLVPNDLSCYYLEFYRDRPEITAEDRANATVMLEYWKTHKKDIDTDVWNLEFLDDLE